MSSSPSAKQRKHSESPADTVLPMYSRTGGQHPRADLNQTLGSLEEAEWRPKRRPFSSFFSGRPLKNLPTLDDQLFSVAKTAQSQPNWPSRFDVPEDNSPRDHAALCASTVEKMPHLRDVEGRTFYRGGKQRLSVMKRGKAEARIIKHVQGRTDLEVPPCQVDDTNSRY